MLEAGGEPNDSAFPRIGPPSSETHRKARCPGDVAILGDIW
jgi:hypothetical protein